MAEAKYPAKTTYGRKGWSGGHNSRKQSLVVGEAWCQENEPASHTVSKAKKHQVINSGTPGFLFSPYNEPQSMGWCCAHSGWVFPRQLTVSSILYTVGVCFHGDSKLHKQIDNGDSPSPRGTERGLWWKENKCLAAEHNDYDEPEQEELNGLSCLALMLAIPTLDSSKIP